MNNYVIIDINNCMNMCRVISINMLFELDDWRSLPHTVATCLGQRSNTS